MSFLGLLWALQSARNFLTILIAISISNASVVFQLNVCYTEQAMWGI